MTPRLLTVLLLHFNPPNEQKCVRATQSLTIYFFASNNVICVSLLNFRISAIFIGVRTGNEILSHGPGFSVEKSFISHFLDMNMIGVAPAGVLFKSNKYSVT